MGLIKYSEFQKKLSRVGLTIGQITGRVVDDTKVVFEVSIVGLDQNTKPVIVEKTISKALYVNDGENLYDMIYKLWHLTTGVKVFIKSNNLFTEVVEWSWGEGPDTGTFLKRVITKEELSNIPEFA